MLLSPAHGRDPDESVSDEPEHPGGEAEDDCRPEDLHDFHLLARSIAHGTGVRIRTKR